MFWWGIYIPSEISDESETSCPLYDNESATIEGTLDKQEDDYDDVAASNWGLGHSRARLLSLQEKKNYRLVWLVLDRLNH